MNWNAIFKERDPTQGSILKCTLLMTWPLWFNSGVWIISHGLNIYWVSRVGTEALARAPATGRVRSSRVSPELSPSGRALPETRWSLLEVPENQLKNDIVWRLENDGCACSDRVVLQEACNFHRSSLLIPLVKAARAGRMQGTAGKSWRPSLQ